MLDRIVHECSYGFGFYISNITKLNWIVIDKIVSLMYLTYTMYSANIDVVDYHYGDITCTYK